MSVKPRCEPKFKAFRIIETHFLWCHVCGRKALKLYTLIVPCPICGVDVEIRICRACLKFLKDEINRVLKEK